MSDVFIKPVLNEEEDTSRDGVDSPVVEKKEVKKRVVRKKKVADFLFDGSKHKQVESYPETLIVPSLHRGQLVNKPTPTGRTLDREVLSDDFIKQYGGGKRTNKFAVLKAKCIYRACEFFGVTPEHLTNAYKLLSGKKIDGFWTTDLIDRFGFTDTEQLSRAQVAKKYNRPNIGVVDVAQNKLRDILNTANVEKAYVDLVKDIKEEFSRDLRDKTVYGEEG